METTSSFLNTWDQYMYSVAVGCVVIGVLILLYHEFKVLQQKELKEKYDYVNLNEIRFIFYTALFLVAALVIYANTIASSRIEQEGIRWFYVRLFITASLAVIGYFIAFSLIRIYYPRRLEKRLQSLRNKPRISPAGNAMRKLSEEEEDVHLEPDQIHQEEVHAVDYDVWIDEKTGFKKIEKYPAYQHAEECSECGFFTLKIDQEEVGIAPSNSERGVLINHYKCSYCGHREKREVAVAKLSTNVA